MTYKLSLQIDGKTKEFVRNEGPTLRDTGNAMILQKRQIDRLVKNAGGKEASEKDIWDNINDTAEMMSKFFHGQFSKQDFVDGLPTNLFVGDDIEDSLISNIMDDCLGNPEHKHSDDEEEDPKKSNVK